jgi:hypothetical protein
MRSPSNNNISNMHNENFIELSNTNHYNNQSMMNNFPRNHNAVENYLYNFSENQNFINKSENMPHLNENFIQSQIKQEAMDGKKEAFPSRILYNPQSLAYSENFNPKSNIKNTYINKINNLMTNSLNKQKMDESKKYHSKKNCCSYFFRKIPSIRFEGVDSSQNISSPRSNQVQTKEENIDMSNMSELGRF